MYVRSTGGILGGPLRPRTRKFEQRWVIPDSGRQPGHRSETGVFSKGYAETNGLKFGSSGRTRTYNPSVNSRPGCAASRCKHKYLCTQKTDSSANWGDSGGTLQAPSKPATSSKEPWVPNIAPQH